MSYRCFSRTWWRHNPSWPRGLEPHLGAKTYLAEFDTEQEARAFCKNWNTDNEPGPLSLKAEFEER